MRRISMPLGGAANDTEERAEPDALLDELSRLGWIEGRNLRIDLRFGAGNPDRIRIYAAELVALCPI
jgi:putative tryptophan/tyrosine transport system substrate-binding protein